MKQRVKGYYGHRCISLLIVLFALPFISCILSSCELKEDSGAPATIGGLNYYLYHNHSATIDWGNTWSGALDIPSVVNYNGKTYIVNCMAAGAFVGSTGLTKVRIPKTIDHIIFHYLGVDGNSAVSPYEMNLFAGCTALESIEVDKDNPFLCSDDGVLFSKDKTQLYAYPAGAKRENYTIPEGATSISNGAFAFCETLQILDVPESVQLLRESVFSSTHLKAVILRGTFPKGLHEGSFAGMDAATVIYVQQSEIENFKKVYSGTVLPLGRSVSVVSCAWPVRYNRACCPKKR